MKIYAILGLALLLFGAIAWIENNAVARFEANLYAETVQVQTQSLADVRNLSSKARSDQAAVLEQARSKIAELEAESAALKAESALIDKQEGTGELCAPGCTPRWTVRPQ